MSGLRLFTNIGELMTAQGVVKKKGRKLTPRDLGIKKRQAFVVDRGDIVWVGSQSRVPKSYWSAKEYDLKGQNVFPGFVDCHTHMVFAGDRRHEFELRNQGMSYQDIAKKGGGILSTMKKTRAASLESLVAQAQKRIDFHMSQGVTCVEVKSGYGLTQKAEEKMLRAAGQLKGPRIVRTFLGAHALPKEYATEALYLEKLKKDLLHIKKQNLSQRVDIFIEKGYFSLAASKAYLSFAQGLGFDITIHADQMTRTGASALGAQIGALSVDHGICLTDRDIQKIAQSNTVAVLLPTADFYLHCSYPQARNLIDGGACVALATDFNPGSSPSQSIPLVGLLARLQMKMRLHEVFAALTYGGAQALGLEKCHGALLPGFKGDFFTSSQSWSDFFYDLGPSPVEKTFVAGVLKFRK